MARDPHHLLSGLLDGEVLDDDAVKELSEALKTPSVREAVRADLETELLLQTVLNPEGDLRESRDRLLAKAILRERRDRRALPRRFRHLAIAGAVAAAAAIVIAVGVRQWLTGPEPYPEISVQGDFAVGAGTAQAGSGRRPPERGERIVAGPGGARLVLGGYCDVDLAAGTEAIVRGGPGEEAVQLNVGRMVSKVTPGQGFYSVHTPAGELDVIGTEFVTTVEHRKGTEMNAKSVIVSVAVLAGVVGFDFGGETGILEAGANRVFAAEVGEGAALPSQTKTGAVRSVDPEARTITVMVARELTFTVTEKTQILEGDTPRTLADIKVGQTVSVLYSFDPNHNRLASRVTLGAPPPAGEAPVPALKVGDPAPDFRLKGTDGQEYTLGQFKEQSAVVLSWYPRAGSGGASQQSDSIEAVMDEISQYRVRVFGISTSTEAESQAFAEKGDYSYPLLSDPDRAVAKAYGVLRTSGIGAGQMPQRWLVLIDDQGIIRGLDKTELDLTAKGRLLLEMLEEAQIPMK